MKIMQFQKKSSKDNQEFSFWNKQYECTSKDLIESTFMELLILLFLRWEPKITYKLFSECLGVFLLVKGSHFFQGIFFQKKMNFPL